MSTYIHNFLAYKELLKELVRRDVKTKYRRSFLGMMWSVLNPLGMMIIMSIVFSHVFRANIENFPVYLMCGQVIFNFFNEASTVAMSSILGNAALIKKVYVPKYLFPMSKVCSCFVNLLTSFIALLIVIVATGTPLSWTVVLLVFPVLYVFLFSLGMGLLLSALVVTFRDLQHLYGVLITAWMYLTPIFYPIEMLPGWVRTIVSCNPLTCIVQMLREVIMYGQVPGLRLQLMCIAPCAVAMILGLWVFYRQQDKFILKV
ncbi:ABC transporter permease [uncultured Merdimonas sp.]|uniref:ABC transporter permease n=1 Tax=uncultured Merdimonas sp. TaxID=2023269 RepID=UPI003207EDA1